MKGREAWRGDRRLRVALDIGARSVRVKALWLVDGPAVQMPILSAAYVALIDVDGETVLVQSFEDPRLSRSIAPPEEIGHHYSLHTRGSVVVDVPLYAARAVSEVRIRIADLSRVRHRPTDPSTLAEFAAAKVRGVRLVGSVETAELARHTDWEAIAADVGISAVTAEGFEIFMDRAGRYRWRLRRGDGKIVADSGQGYRDRQSCEADLRWIRSRGAGAPVRSLDLDEQD